MEKGLEGAKGRETAEGLVVQGESQGGKSNKTASQKNSLATGGEGYKRPTSRGNLRKAVRGRGRSQKQKELKEKWYRIFGGGRGG